MATGLSIVLAVALGVFLCNHQSAEVGDGAVSLIGFVSLNSTEYGLKIKSDGHIDNSTVYETGRHWLGPGESMVKFPAGNQTLKGQMRGAWTKLGREVSFNY